MNARAIPGVTEADIKAADEERRLDLDEATEDLAYATRWLERLTAVEELLDGKDAPELVKQARYRLETAATKLNGTREHAIKRIQRLQQEQTAADFGDVDEDEFGPSDEVFS